MGVTVTVHLIIRGYGDRVTVTVHLIIKISQTPINKILDSGLSSLYVLTTRGDARVLLRADI
jgi:hypothetical protein